MEGTTEVTDKPPYRLPSIGEIAAVRGSTGLKVVSTFSGCGGSCLGFEQAGFEVVWASEFVEAARDTYRANHPHTILDGRDIRTVTASEILSAVGMEAGQLDVFNGSPPCASFSTAGKREKGWGKVKKYSDTEQRTDDLFDEYIRLVDGLRPRVFVAENVSGLVKGTAIGYFKHVMRSLSALGYDVDCRVLDAQWLGVPQTRARTIFVGVRNDLGSAPVFPRPIPWRYVLRDAVPWIDEPGARLVEEDAWMTRFATGKEWARLRPGQQSERYFQLVRCRPDEPIGCVTASGGHAGLASVSHPFECRKFSIEELRLLCSFPSDFVLTGSYIQRWERLGRAVPPRMMAHVARTIRDGIFAPLGMVREGFSEVI